MPRDRYNIVPVTLAVILHVILFGSLLVAFDWTSAEQRVPPLAIKATLIVDELPAVVEIPDAEPTPPPPQPEPDDEARIKAEEAKRLADLKAEEERRARERREQEEAERLAQQERERLAREEAERKAREEAELEEKRRRMAEEREKEIQRQREENRRQEEELLASQQLAMLEQEENAMELANSTEMQVYMTMIRQTVQRNWQRPGTTPDNLSCVVVVEQQTGGVIRDARISECNTSDEIVRRTILAAVNRSSPLPQPSNPLLFLSTFEIEFTYDD